MKVDVRKEKSVQIVSYFNDFDGDVRKWQEAFFELLSWNNTWSTCYVLEICASRARGTFVRVTPHNPDTVDSVIGMMEGLGYKGFKTDDVTIGLAEYCGCDEIVFE